MATSYRRDASPLANFRVHFFRLRRWSRRPGVQHTKERLLRRSFMSRSGGKAFVIGLDRKRVKLPQPHSDEVIEEGDERLITQHWLLAFARSRFVSWTMVARFRWNGACHRLSGGGRGRGGRQFSTAAVAPPGRSTALTAAPSPAPVANFVAAASDRNTYSGSFSGPLAPRSVAAAPTSAPSCGT